MDPEEVTDQYGTVENYNVDLHRTHNSQTVVADSENKMEVGHHQNFDFNKVPAHRRARSVFDNQNYNVDLHRLHNSQTVMADSENNMEVGHNQNFDCNKDSDHRRACSMFDNQIPGEGFLYKTHTSMSPFGVVGAG
ncbi:hypothetical protein Tco_1396527 [Tanacetum coccineum]